MKRIIHTEKAPQAVGPYSQAVEINNMLFISGQIPIDPSTGDVIDGDITWQTEQVMENIGAILKEAGYGFEHVIKSTCLLTDMDHFPAFNEVYGRFYPEDPPARATFAAAGLPLGVLVEVETLAIKG